MLDLFQGTLVRVWDTVTGERLHELGRGADLAEIISIAFSFNSAWLVMSSVKGTIHVFALVAPDADQKFELNGVTMCSYLFVSFQSATHRAVSANGF